MLGSGRIELRLILKFEQELQRATDSELLVQAPLGGLVHGLPAARMGTAAVRPIQRPEALGRSALLYEQLTFTVEYQKGKSPMQNALTFVATSLAQLANVSIGCIDQNERIQISPHAPRLDRMACDYLIHRDNPTFVARPPA
jgi:hypothetical protein